MIFGIRRMNLRTPVVAFTLTIGLSLAIVDRLQAQDFFSPTPPAAGYSYGPSYMRSASPVLLHEPTVLGQNISELVVSPDSSRVVYRADHDEIDAVELYSAPTDGSSQAVKISGTLTQGGAVQSPLQVTADSAAVLFIADRAADEVYELFAASLTGGQLPFRMHPPLVDPREFRRWSGTRRSVGF